MDTTEDLRLKTERANQRTSLLLYSDEMPRDFNAGGLVQIGTSLK
jgi:hypothetical protein